MSTESWQQWYATPREVYVWRGQIAGADIQSAEDLQLVMTAVAKSQASRLDSRNLDVRAAALWAAGSGQQPVLDVVMTSDISRPYVVRQPAERVAEGALADPDLRLRYPQLRFASSEWLRLTGPADAVDFWVAHPIVWDYEVGPTADYVKLVGLYRGMADDAPKLSPITGASLDPLPSHPDDDDPQLSWVAMMALGVAAATAVWLGATYFGGGRP